MNTCTPIVDILPPDHYEITLTQHAHSVSCVIFPFVQILTFYGLSHLFTPPLVFLCHHSLMQHTSNLEQYCAQLLLSRFYAAHPCYEQGTKWQSDRSGHVLANRLTSANAVASIIGRVLDYCLNCGPNGGYLNRGVGSLTAKYQFLLCKPENTPFAQDFDKVCKHLEHLQSSVASTKSCCNLFVVDIIGRNI